jgi:phosphate transport system protein
MEGHIVRGFDGDLLHLKMRVLEMAGLVIDQVSRAVGALVDGDDEAARAIADRDLLVDEYDGRVEEESVALIARRQPVASDLRAIMAVTRAATDLARIGDCAKKIARLAVDIHAVERVVRLDRFYHDVRKMARLSTAMLRDAIDCFDRVEVERAAAVVRRDQDLDREFDAALRDLVTFVMEDQRNLRHTIHTVFVIKALERIGDHAKNIAEYVPRLQTAADLRDLALSHRAAVR